MKFLYTNFFSSSRWIWGFCRVSRLDFSRQHHGCRQLTPRGIMDPVKQSSSSDVTILIVADKGSLTILGMPQTVFIGACIWFSAPLPLHLKQGY